MIRRAEHSADKRFFLFTRKTAQDKNLSFQATGLLAYVLSRPPGWTAKDSDLMKRGGIKRHALTTILDELKERGYARRVRERQKDGTFGFFLDIAEEPTFSNESPLPDFPIVESPLVDNRVVAIDSTGAGACSSSDLTDLREKEPKRKRSHRPPEPPVVLDPPHHGTKFIEALDRYAKVKIEMKSPLTPTMTEALYLKLAKFDEETATMALEEAAASGYKGVFPDKVNGKGNGYSKRAEQEYTGPVKSVPDPVKENCQECRGSGTVHKVIDGITYGMACKHRAAGVVAA